MRKLIPLLVLAIVTLLAIVQFGPSLLFAQEKSHAKACHYRDHRSAAGQLSRPYQPSGRPRARSGRAIFV